MVHKGFFMIGFLAQPLYMFFKSKFYCKFLFPKVLHHF